MFIPSVPEKKDPRKPVKHGIALARVGKHLWLGNLAREARSKFFFFIILFIGPESDHCLPLSVTHSLTHSLTDSCSVNLIDVTLACEDASSKLVKVVAIANVDDEDLVGNSLLQIWELRFGHKAKLLFRL